MTQWNLRWVLPWLGVVALGACGGGGSNMSAAPPAVAPQNAPPAVSNIPDQRIDEDGVAGPVVVTVTDAETDPAALDVTVASSNTTLLPESGIELTGRAAERIMVLVPAAGQSGSAEVTLTVADRDGASTSSRFRLVVDPLVRAEFATWMREIVLARGELDAAVGELHDDGSALGDTENIGRIRFSDATADEPAAYDDLLPPPG